MSDDIFGAIKREREHQIRKYGDAANRPRSIGEYLLVMQIELQEAIDEWGSTDGNDGALEEILQVVSVGVACMQEHGVMERV